MTAPLPRTSVDCEDGDEHEFFVKDLLFLLPPIEGPCKRCHKPIVKGYCCTFCGSDECE